MNQYEQKKFQKPIDTVIKEAKLKEEARERLEKSRRKMTEFQNIWNKFYMTGE